MGFGDVRVSALNSLDFRLNFMLRERTFHLVYRQLKLVFVMSALSVVCHLIICEKSAFAQVTPLGGT